MSNSKIVERGNLVLKGWSDRSNQLLLGGGGGGGEGR